MQERNNNKVDSIETGRTVIAHLLPWSNQKNYFYITLFQLLTIKFHRHSLILNTFSLVRC